MALFWAACTVQLFFAHESAARDNEILGEEGVKKAVEAKKAVSGGKDSDVESLSGWVLW